MRAGPSARVSLFGRSRHDGLPARYSPHDARRGRDNHPELPRALNGRRPASYQPSARCTRAMQALIRRAPQIAGSRDLRRRNIPSSSASSSTRLNSDPAKTFPDTRDNWNRTPPCARRLAPMWCFASIEEVYPAGQERVADGFVIPLPPDVADKPGLEDAFRPGHFMGVMKVVARLFDIVQPSHAVFGEKDYQQLLVIRAIVEREKDRWRGLTIVPHPTEREADGLAMSSRNMYLDSEWRKRALGLHEALQLAQKMAKAGLPPLDIENQMTFQLFMRGFEVDYAAVRDAATLMPVECIDRPCRADRSAGGTFRRRWRAADRQRADRRTILTLSFSPLMPVPLDQRDVKRRHPLCPACGYDLVASIAAKKRVCPECGETFTLEDVNWERRAGDWTLTKATLLAGRAAWPSKFDRAACRDRAVFTGATEPAVGHAADRAVSACACAGLCGRAIFSRNLVDQAGFESVLLVLGACVAATIISSVGSVVAARWVVGIPGGGLGVIHNVICIFGACVSDHSSTGD